HTGKNTNHTQGKMAALLCTTDETSFGERWEFTLNTFIPGDIMYKIFWSKEYTHNAWIEKLKKLILESIDNGFPVIADTFQSKEKGFLTSNYKEQNKDEIAHYITVIGYMIKSDGSCYFRYMDSCAYNHGVYTVPLYTLASITHNKKAGGLVCYRGVS
ncbi:MAG TPA: hypothetical protein DCM59_03910, partial [Clostridium sp.]|nr:hypothetical protein [Clostridium sp.]